MSIQRVDQITDAAGTGAPTFTNGIVGNHAVWVENGNGFGSTNTKIRRFSSTTKNVGTAITYADSATLGASFTINETGLYVIAYADLTNPGSGSFGITLNNAALTTAIGSLADGSTIVTVTQSSSGLSASCSGSVRLVAGDVIRPHGDGSQNGTGYFSSFRIAKVGV